MKITGVKTMSKRTNMAWLVGKKQHWKGPRAVAGCIADIKPMILGEDTQRFEYL